MRNTSIYKSGERAGPLKKILKPLFCLCENDTSRTAVEESLQISAEMDPQRVKMFEDRRAEQKLGSLKIAFL